MLARGAMFHRYAMNEKRAKEERMFNAKLARKRVLSDMDDYKEAKELTFTKEQHQKAHSALKDYMSAFRNQQTTINQKK